MLSTPTTSFETYVQHIEHQEFLYQQSLSLGIAKPSFATGPSATPSSLGWLLQSNIKVRIEEHGPAAHVVSSRA